MGGKVVFLVLLVVVAAEEDRYWAVNYNITMKNIDGTGLSDRMEFSEVFPDEEGCYNVLEIFKSKE